MLEGLKGWHGSRNCGNSIHGSGDFALRRGADDGEDGREEYAACEDVRGEVSHVRRYVPRARGGHDEKVCPGHDYWPVLARGDDINIGVGDRGVAVFYRHGEGQHAPRDAA